MSRSQYRPPVSESPHRGGSDRGTSGAAPAAAADRGALLSVPEDVTLDNLDPEIQDELRSLPLGLAEAVGRWLAAAGLDPDPERSYEYACQARRLAARVGVVRETCGIAAYRSGRWAEALSELRTARRLTGQTRAVAVMADCERALGRPDRAMAIINDPGERLDRATVVELRIVASGIRRDEGRPDAAVMALQIPELTDGEVRPWSARLFYAYADALLDAGREEEALEWFGHAADADDTDETDADERYESLGEVIAGDTPEPEPPSAPEEDEPGPG